MSCCGKKRTQLNLSRNNQQLAESAGNRSSEMSVSSTHIMENLPSVNFQYIGNQSLTVIGPGTQKRYRFVSRDAIVAVDAQDVRALGSVPTLRKLQE